MELQQPAVHRTILVVDVEGFGDLRRTNKHQLTVRDGLYQAMRDAFGKSGIPWDGCHHEDRGDGVLVLARPEIPKALFIDFLPEALVRALHEHNVDYPGEECQIRLRMALHAGEIELDSHGVTSKAVNLAFRLLDAGPLKSALAESSGALAVITSAWFFDEVVRHSDVTDPSTFRPVEVTVKETVTTAWIGLPDDPYEPDAEVLKAERYAPQFDQDANALMLQKLLGTGDAVVIVVGNELAALYQALTPAGQDQPRQEVGDSFDFAVDAAGKTVDQVSRRIITSAGIRPDESSRPSEQVRAGTPPMTVVITGVDDAEQPEALLDEVLRPLAEQGTRLVLGFRQDASPSLALARSWEFGSVADRLGRLAERIAALGADEQQLMLLRAKTGHGGTPLEEATKLRFRLTALRRGAAVHGPQWTDQYLERFERAVATAVRRTGQETKQLGGTIAKRDELRGTLRGYRAIAVDCGMAEDLTLAALYQRAHDHLFQLPLDLEAAETAVHAYQIEIRRMTDK